MNKFTTYYWGYGVRGVSKRVKSIESQKFPCNMGSRASDRSQVRAYTYNLVPHSLETGHMKKYQDPGDQYPTNITLSLIKLLTLF